jgi:hypothetical protein
MCTSRPCLQLSRLTGEPLSGACLRRSPGHVRRACTSSRLCPQAIPAAIRRRVEDAVESLAARVTAGDVAARAGIRVAEAETALNALAADTLGTLQVCCCTGLTCAPAGAQAQHARFAVPGMFMWWQLSLGWLVFALLQSGGDVTSTTRPQPCARLVCMGHILAGWCAVRAPARRCTVGRGCGRLTCLRTLPARQDARGPPGRQGQGQVPRRVRRCRNRATCCTCCPATSARCCARARPGCARSLRWRPRAARARTPCASASAPR